MVCQDSSYSFKLPVKKFGSPLCHIFSQFQILFDKKGSKTIGHIRYNLDKAWALMEKAGYDMDPFRDAVEAEEVTEEDSPLPVLPILFAVLGLAVLRLIRRSRR